VDVPLLHYTSLLGQHSLSILDKELVRTILTAPVGKDKKERFRKDYFFLKTRIGEGLVTLEGPDWMRHRRMSHHPAFVSHTRSPGTPRRGCSTLGGAVGGVLEGSAGRFRN
jgi:cytochrome P450